MTEPTEMSFDEAMHAECPHCHEPAMKHRMTDTGNSYCLVPTYDYERAVGWHGGSITKALLSHTPVKNLKRSFLGKEVGLTIRSGLGAYL